MSGIDLKVEHKINRVAYSRPTISLFRTSRSGIRWHKNQGFRSLCFVINRVIAERGDTV